jgi:hypothetical protein
MLLGAAHDGDDPALRGRLGAFRCRGGALTNAILRDGVESSLDERPFFARVLKSTERAPQHAEVGLSLSGKVFVGGTDWGG